jgi:hypothetical protein
MPAWYRPNSTLYYAVAAMDTNGNISQPSRFVSVATPPTSSRNAKTLNNLVNPPKNTLPNVTVPPVPINLKVRD